MKRLTPVQEEQVWSAINEAETNQHFPSNTVYVIEGYVVGSSTELEVVRENLDLRLQAYENGDIQALQNEQSSWSSAQLDAANEFALRSIRGSLKKAIRHVELVQQSAVAQWLTGLDAEDRKRVQLGRRQLKLRDGSVRGHALAWAWDSLGNLLVVTEMPDGRVLHLNLYREELARPSAWYRNR